MMKSLSDNSFHGNYNGGGFILSYGGEDVPKGGGVWEHYRGQRLGGGDVQYNSAFFSFCNDE